MFEFIRHAARQFASPAGAFSLVVAALLGAVVADGQLRRSSAPKGEQARATDTASRQVLQDGSDWLSEAFWARKRSKRLEQQYGYFSPESNAFDPGRDDSRRRRGASARPVDNGHYRTVCVRLCDGYYFPISFSTTRDRFEDDEKVCRSTCNADVRLFYHPSSEPEADKLKDLEGRDYADLDNAFVYRSHYRPSCQCQPQPWSDEARQRHALYATEAWQKKAASLANAEERRSMSSGSRVRVVHAGDDTEATEAGLTAPDNGARMSLGRGSGRRSGAPVRVQRNPDRNWRKRVFNRLTD